MTHKASCSCGRIRLRCSGAPLRISVCHCLECQKRTGSAFGAQAQFSRESVEFVSGEPSTFVKKGDAGSICTRRFCSDCGSTVWWSHDAAPDRIYVALGAFADPAFPAPTVAVYDERRHPWVGITGVEVFE